MPWRILGSSIDLFHALVMLAWVAGLPLLFWHRWPRVTRAYGAFAIVFVIISQLSQALLGECIFTTLARACWQRAAPDRASAEWFTVRLAQAVFNLTPTHHAIKIVSEAIIVVCAAGMLFSLRRLSAKRDARPAAALARRAPSAVGALAPRVPSAAAALAVTRH